MGYSADDEMVRVDFFRPSGKWYCAEAVRWTGSYIGDIHKAFAISLRNHLKGGRLSEMDAVCLEPCHENAHPIQLKAGSWLKKEND